MSAHRADDNEASPDEHRLRLGGSLSRAFVAVESALVVFAGFVVIAMMLMVTADVVSRTFFNFPLPNSYEYMELGMVFVVYLGAAQVQREKRHVTIDTIIKHLPPRLRAAIELLGCLIGFVLMSAIGWWGALAAWNSYMTSEYVGSVARLPVLPARLALVVGVVALLIRLVFDIVEYTRKIIQPDDELDLVEGSI
jgi:TRAP-type C4-dicarboxylate transport system permease small subunit